MVPKDLGKTTTGIEANVSALLCYLGGFITGIIFYIIEKDNKFVRFHAVQSIAVFGGLFVFNVACGMVLPGIMRGIISMLVGVLSVVLWVVLMAKSYRGEKYKLPIAGDIAEKHA